MAKLDRLTIQGFKSIRSLEDFELRGLNVLIGPNGAGKSNFLSLFRLLDHLSRERLQLFVKQEGGPDALLFGGRKHSSNILVEVFSDGVCFRYPLSLDPDANTPVFSAIMTPGTPRWRVFHFLDMSLVRAASVRLPYAVDNNIEFQQDAANLTHFIRRLCKHHPDHYLRIIETVRLAVPFFGDFVHRQDNDTSRKMLELEWSHADDPDSVFGPSQLSDGALRFVCLATLLLQPTDLQPELILIDEPELGLHPYALTLLAEMLQHASDERQVIVSTQSADLISELEPEDVVVVDRNDGASVFTRLKRVGLSDWLEDHSLGDLWKMDVLGGRPGP